MSNTLNTYRAKRNFAITPEPAPEPAQESAQESAQERHQNSRAATDTLSFVIQKHWATRLHYDFRLELDGAMKSWAVPKGPSFDPHDKRMAVEVEDHPIAYSSFEGSIPEHQYGAGKVIIWDKGSWHPLGDPQQGLRDGQLKFELRGHKLHGKWVLVRMKGRDEKKTPWLLIKEKDEFVRPASEFSVVDEMPDSVKGLPAPAGAPARANAPAPTSARAPAAAPTPARPHARKPARAGSDADAADRAAANRDGADSDGEERGSAVGELAALPATCAPQLATLVDAAPADAADWLFEIKFDGYRLLARIDGAKITLHTRTGLDWTHKLAALQAELARMRLPAGWYDGEIVVLDAQGRPDFGALQLAFDRASTGRIVYFLFDVPYFDGRDLRALALEQRRALLGAALAQRPSEQVRFSEQFDAPGDEIVAAACRIGLEGVIGKRRGAPYVARRSDQWIKLKCGQRQEFVIGGYTDPRGARSGIGALLLGTYDAQGELVYAGNVGTGFDEATLLALAERLHRLDAPQCPFADVKRIAGRPHWVRPELVAEVRFAQWTKDGSVRHAVFQGLRTDKEARVVVREIPKHPADRPNDAVDTAANVQPDAKANANADANANANTNANANANANANTRGAKANAAPRVAAAAADTARGARVEVHATLPPGFKISNPDRVIDPHSGGTKLDLVRYYALVGPLMLNHLRGRPVSLVRAPDGVEGQLFFQKHAETNKLPGVRHLDPALDPGHAELLEVATQQGLLVAAQWNVIELHTQNAHARDYAHPNRLVFDLDPGQDVAWPTIQEAAILLRAFLDELGLTSFVKTSGGKGLHVVVPIKPQFGWDNAKAFSQAVVAHMAQAIPQRFVAKSGPSNRIGKIFIDYLRNGRGATTACAWSARARPGLGISVPLDWDELDKVKAADQWNIANVHTRLARGNAPWSAYTRSARALGAAMKRLGFTPADEAD